MKTMMVGGTLVAIDDTTVQWRAGMTVDADGCPRAYRLDGTGLDYTADAGHDGDWYGVDVDAQGKPIIQGPNDPSPGSLVSTTAMADHRYPEGDPRRYVDADVVPYGSIPPELRYYQGRELLRMGDVGIAVYRGVEAAFILADVGPHGKLWEASMETARLLKMDASPRDGGVGGGVSVVVWRDSFRGWPRSVQSIIDQVAQLRAPQVIASSSIATPTSAG